MSTYLIILQYNIKIHIESTTEKNIPMTYIQINTGVITINITTCLEVF